MQNCSGFSALAMGILQSCTKHQNREVCKLTDWSLVISLEVVSGLCPANERRCYKVTLSLIGWVQT